MGKWKIYKTIIGRVRKGERRGGTSTRGEKLKMYK